MISWTLTVNILGTMILFPGHQTLMSCTPTNGFEDTQPFDVLDSNHWFPGSPPLISWTQSLVSAVRAGESGWSGGPERLGG